MRAYLIRRLLQILPVFFGILVFVFLIIELSPGGPAGNFITPGMRAHHRQEIEERLGLNEPLPTRFVTWISNAVRGDFGRSFQFRHPVLEVLRPSIEPTFTLAILSLLLALLVGIPAGIISATKQYSAIDNFLTVFSLIGISMPSFFFALILIRIFTVQLGWTPLFGLSDPLFQAPHIFAAIGHRLWHMILPTIVLGLGSTATFMRYTRSSMLEVIKSDYIRTARAKGLSEKIVIYRHAFRNAIIPIITLLGFWIPGVFSGAVITETIFGLPGMGRVTVQAAQFRDYPIILATTTIIALLTLISTLLADVLYAAADPRIKYD